jgi:predicted metalloprotease with PDZ domain
VHWDLSDLAPGAAAISTFGDGDFELRGSPETANQGWYMAGPLGTYPGHARDKGFSAAWLGQLPFDGPREMEWASKVYAYLAKRYGYLDPPPRYRVFMRSIANGGRGGTALANSFMLATGPDLSQTAEAVRQTITHEMSHMWVGLMSGPEGITSWFTEGLNVYYTRLLSLGGGFISVDEYRRDINSSFRTYITNDARNLSAEAIVKIGFGAENVRHVPYMRGSLYFADVDSKIRAASGGKRNLDMLARELFDRRRRGEPLTQEVWIEAVVKEIGPSARDDFERVNLRGETIVPASDAFGPCLERHATKYDEADGKQAEGFEWVRVASVPDARCRAW